jgi:hypothetical protein
MSEAFIIQQQEPGCSCCGSSNEWGGKDMGDFDNDGGSNDMATIAKEMNELSVKEREQVLEELHGVAEAHEETPEFVSNRMQSLDKCLAELPKSSRKALDRALFFRPDLATDHKFKLMYLRATSYDPYQTARRIAKYYEDKLTLFGEKKLAKVINLEDLEDVDKKMFDLGCCVILPQKDNSGRPIWFFDMRTFNMNCITSMVRGDEVPHDVGPFESLSLKRTLRWLTR